MATFLGFTNDDHDNGVTDIGRNNTPTAGVGSLTVNAAETLDLTNATLDTQKFQQLLVGEGIGADGTVTINAGGKIVFDATGQDDTGTQLIIGRNGGAGVMNVAGGTFQMIDPSTVGFDTVNEDDEEIVIIGRTNGSNGQLHVSAGGSFLIEGNSVNVQIGRAGGTGSATFAGGSHLNLTAGGDGADSSVLIRVGNGAGSVGTLSFDASDAVLQANPDNSAGFIVGLNDGTGDFQLLNGSEFTVNGGANGAQAVVGQGLGSDGTLTLDGASELTFQQGTGDNGLNVGRDGGTGTLSVEAGSTLKLEGGNNVYFNVGVGTDGDDPATASTGAATVTGATSKITLQAQVGDIDGAQISMAIGVDGGNGTLNVLAGATFEIIDTSTAAIIDPDYIGSEYIVVGRGEGSVGALTVDASTFTFTGGAPEFQIGRNGGNGTVLFDHGATFTETSLTDNDPGQLDYGTSEAGMQIGRENGGVGALTFDHGSSGTMTSGAFSDAYLNVGRDQGTGTFTIKGGSDFTLNGGTDGAFTQIGSSGGHGTLNVLEANSTLLLNGGDGQGQLRIGTFDGNANRRGGGTGVANINGDGTTLVTVQGDNGARGSVGGMDSNGTLNIWGGAELKFLGTGENGLDVGVDGGIGDVHVYQNSAIRMIGAGEAYLNVGRGETGYGRIDIESAMVQIKNTSNGQAGANVGSEGAVGALNLRDGSLLIESVHDAYLNLGQGGDALVDLMEGTVVLRSSATPGDGGTFAVVGADDGRAFMTMRGSTWTFDTQGDAALNIGGRGSPDAADSGAGTLNVLNGSRVDFSSAGGFTSIGVGAGAGSEGRLLVAGGSVIDMDAAGLATGSNIKIGAQGAASALVTVDGKGSRIDHAGYVQVGYDPTDPGNSFAGGHGTLLIKNGGIVNADFTAIGAGGVLAGYRGTLNSDVGLNGGGSIDLRDGVFGTLTVNGSIESTGAGNSLSLDIGLNQSDRLIFDDFDNSAGQLFVNLNVLGGYQFFAGETREIIAIHGNVPTVFVTGEGANFGYYAGRLASDPDDSVYLKSINGGGNAALAVLDFGVGGPLASVVYDANANNGTVMGGIFGYPGGRAYNIDYFQGTNLGDTFTIVGATARSFIYDGRLGNDTVNGGAGIDNVTGGGGVDTLRGNAGNDILNGGTEGDILYGGLGNDSLTGGAGNDFFYFNTALNASNNKDSISDYNAAQDTFRLENAIFTKLAAVGALNPAFFKAAAAAADVNDYIVYNRATGALFYDSNGNGAGGAIQFATLINKPVLTSADFQVI